MRSRGWLDDTIIAVTSDHGEEFWEYGRWGHGKSLSEEVLHVPLLLHYEHDHRARGGRRISTPGQLVDVLPTLLDLAGVETPEGLDGRSLLSHEQTESRVLFSSLRMDEFDLRSARRHPWKLVWNHEQNRRDLYDLRKPAPERSAIPVGANPETARARKELADSLAKSLAEPAGRTESVAELPHDVEESLRALGYLEAAEDPAGAK